MGLHSYPLAKWVRPKPSAWLCALRPQYSVTYQIQRKVVPHSPQSGRVPLVYTGDSFSNFGLPLCCTLLCDTRQFPDRICCNS